MHLQYTLEILLHEKCVLYAKKDVNFRCENIACDTEFLLAKKSKCMFLNIFPYFIIGTI